MSEELSLLLNGSLPDRIESRKFAKALSDPASLTSSGGWLFKSRREENAIYIGIVPALSEGQRLHHYDIRVPEGEHLIGSISANGEISLLFKAEAESLDTAAMARWKAQYRGFAGVLIQCGYHGEGKLDWITQKIIEESGIFQPVPLTLGEIS